MWSEAIEVQPIAATGDLILYNESDPSSPRYTVQDIAEEEAQKVVYEVAHLGASTAILRRVLGYRSPGRPEWPETVHGLPTGQSYLVLTGPLREQLRGLLSSPRAPPPS